jgi:hypothetical protein
MAMKKMVQKLALLWISFLTLVGFSKSRLNSYEPEQRSKVSRHRVVILDEHEISAFHTN